MPLGDFKGPGLMLGQGQNPQGQGSALHEVISKNQVAPKVFQQFACRFERARKHPLFFMHVIPLDAALGTHERYQTRRSGFCPCQTG
ncbi:MAG: hypothetical protein A2527_02460 [Candidatus Lambdaproteobacteria bacterium RIFOXYD2_FULL_50_16]|uniref:Uncharacterized protein n=1 Tax=Candidatus Lambdaproteobacteria bacterium RIFOXYD2_FULL_50_16 TaxID=1817772 RepID=A0A1F6GDZ4_9PROT|nr:MAG: hypothetical protein A2527_02460 [Candidatus Lambdaproteobacteria bacterium RIFOXYD2_FULL_50_16]